MPFSMKERETLLAIRGIGPMVLKRLEEMRLDSLAKLSRTSAPDIAAAIAARRTTLSPEEAKQLAVRAVQFKKERGRLPSISSADPWEKRMAEGAAAFVRFKDKGSYE